ELKENSQADTDYDTAHSLALALRDSGSPDIALLTFLEGRELSELLEPDELDEQRSGSHYGNVGRCLHLMGQIEQALICYQKSAIVLERENANEQVLNQGFARKWIGEVLATRGQYCLGQIFLRSAHQKWMLVAPPRANHLAGVMQEITKYAENCPDVP